MDVYNDVLRKYGISIGLCGEDGKEGTFEWYESSTGEYKNGFDTTLEAYLSAAEYLDDQSITVPSLDEDGNLVDENGDPVKP